ncbi:MAG: ACT domain-containing protein [Oscillospiraceae bacterium]|nr:ACT domain-containing protein [Oscillospiraceae bacterium]
MNAIVTVIGKDRVGIIAAVCIKLAGLNINVLDISQTIMQGNFTMIMAVDVSQATASFAEIRDALADLGKEMELSIRIQREEIFNAMHSI